MTYSISCQRQDKALLDMQETIQSAVAKAMSKVKIIKRATARTLKI